MESNLECKEKQDDCGNGSITLHPPNYSVTRSKNSWRPPPGIQSPSVVLRRLCKRSLSFISHKVKSCIWSLYSVFTCFISWLTQYKRFGLSLTFHQSPKQTKQKEDICEERGGEEGGLMLGPGKSLLGVSTFLKCFTVRESSWSVLFSIFYGGFLYVHTHD